MGQARFIEKILNSIMTRDSHHTQRVTSKTPWKVQMLCSKPKRGAFSLTLHCSYDVIKLSPQVFESTQHHANEVVRMEVRATLIALHE